MIDLALFRTAGRTVEPADFDSLALAFGFEIPGEFKQLMETVNGGRFVDLERISWQVGPPRRLFSVSDEEAVGALIGDELINVPEDVPRGWLPIADDYGGNTFFLRTDQSPGEVWFFMNDSWAWDGIPPPPEDREDMVLVAPSLQGFLDLLVAERS